MKKTVLLLFSVAALLCACKQAPSKEEVAAVIFETDMGNDVDDALAADMLFKYAAQGKIRLLGMGLNKDWEDSREYLDILNTWYGCPDLPVGVVHGGASYADDENCYASRVCRLKDADGKPLFPRSKAEYASLPDAVELYRKLLSESADGTVDIVSVGFSTNLSRLLASEPDDVSPLSGKKLIEGKVRRLVVMGGNFDGRKLTEFNIVKDIPSAKNVLENWPTEVVITPFELGERILFPGSAIEETATLTPVTEGYKAFQAMPYDRPTWDLTAVLYAVEGPGWFTLSPTGRVEVTEDGGTIFSEDPDGKCKYLMVSDLQADSIGKRLTELFKETYVR